MDDELCLAPQLCIRCRSYRRHVVVVVSNADACTCPDDETCPHNKKYTLKKKTSLGISTAKVDDYDDVSRSKGERDDGPAESDDDDRSSSSSNSTTSSGCTATTSESDSDYSS